MRLVLCLLKNNGVHSNNRSFRHHAETGNYRRGAVLADEMLLRAKFSATLKVHLPLQIMHRTLMLACKVLNDMQTYFRAVILSMLSPLASRGQASTRSYEHIGTGRWLHTGLLQRSSKIQYVCDICYKPTLVFQGTGKKIQRYCSALKLTQTDSSSRT